MSDRDERLVLALPGGLRCAAHAEARMARPEDYGVDPFPALTARVAPTPTTQPPEGSMTDPETMTPAARAEEATLTELVSERKRWDTDAALRAEFGDDRELFERHVMRGVDEAVRTKVKADAEAWRLGRPTR